MRFTHFIQTLAGACALAASAAMAQAFPSKIMSMIVPYPAGGPSDVIARVVNTEMGRQLGQTIIVENVAGAGGSIGVQKLVNAPADGHTLLLGTPMELVLTPLGMAAARYKPEDVRPVGRWGATSMVLLARKDLPANSVEELIALARRPASKELAYGSIGPGSLYHLLGERFSQLTGAKLLHVPYKGGAPLVQDLLGGQIDIVFMPLAGNIPDLIEGGKVKALGLAATSRHGHPRLGQIPLLKDTRGLEDFVYGLWSGVQVSRNVPEEVALKINRAVNEALKVPEVRRAIEAGGSTAANGATLAELARGYAADIESYRAIARSINLQPQ